MRTILLAGGAEFGGEMEAVDRLALALAGGAQARVSIIPAAAAPDGNHLRAGGNGVKWFRRLGASVVDAVPLIDRASADDPPVVDTLGKSTLIYLLGGSPRHLSESLAGSRAWAALLAAADEGAIVAGSSAGAMVLCDRFYDPHGRQLNQGLGLLKNGCVLPHHATFGKRWAPILGQLVPRDALIGIDEGTGMLGDDSGGEWRVYGRGSVTLYRANRVNVYRSGDSFRIRLGVR